MSAHQIKEENRKRRFVAKNFKNAGAKYTRLIKDPNAPKRPLSPYVLFYMETREGDVSATVGAKEAAARWKTLSDAEKRVNIYLLWNDTNL